MTGALEFVAMEVQPAEERRAVATSAATKLLQSSDAGTTQRRRVFYSKERQSSRCDHNHINNSDLLSRKLARCWKKFAVSKKTTLALVQAFVSSGINHKSVKNMSFENLAMAMESPPVLQATRALLDRLETRLVISSPAPLENVDHLLKHLAAPPPRTTKPAAAPRRRARSSGSGVVGTTAPSPAAVTVTQRSSQENRVLPRYSLRVVLCAYMIVAHPSAVLSGQHGDGEAQLMASAARFIEELELLTKTVLDGPSASGRKFRDQLAAFDGAWCAYLYLFVAWKTRDAAALEGDLVGAACRLELSMLQTCKLTTAADGRSSPSPAGNLTHDMKAIQRQVADDQKLLRDKVQMLSGDAGVARMESALSDTRSKFFQANKNAAPKPAEDDVAAPASLSIDSSSASSSPSPSPSPVMKQPTENERLVNEMLHDGSVFSGKSDDSAAAAAAAAENDGFQQKLRETMEKAFWDLVTESMTGDKPDYSYLVSLVKEVRDSLHELSPKGWKEEILEKIDVEILSQVLVGSSGSQDAQYHLVQILQYSLGMVRRLSAAAKEDELKKSHDKMLAELMAASSEAGDGASSFVAGTVRGLRFAMEEIKQLQAEVSKARIELAMQRMVQGSNGVEYLQNAFADRHGRPGSAGGARASLPLTVQWISTSKNVAKQEWREHLGSLSSVAPPSAAGQLVPVLRAGHGGAAAVRQPSSSAAAAGGVSGQPECKGDELDKLARIGLLQLVSGVEGLQMQSIPEIFQINLMRLRAVQSQFQHVIVIATSMLILRQVLMGESSKPTAQELENTTAELFDALVKTLDGGGGSRDAGAEEIVEAMMSASAAVGSPSSEENVQARRQTAARVLLKSLQPGDAVFRMVTRAVFCAFRGVVLGGGALKGRKLADAALRRVGAARLVDTVVKASEVLIKVAMVSGKVHGPWYKALL